MKMNINFQFFESARRSPVRSTLGSLSEGAVSPNGLTEGVYLVIWRNPMILHRSL